MSSVVVGSVTTAWHLLRLQKEDMPSRFGGYLQIDSQQEFLELLMGRTAPHHKNSLLQNVT
jgi:hypothetical protein